ncbi:MAG TPA: DUF2784 domain-containing protein [Bryobacteraceae bacterium]|nr:DUF2784 domain-containing protein [Bryobacteraceae bacterium]
MDVYQALSIAVLMLHLAWIVFVAVGCLVTRGRRVLTGIHLVSLVWGIIVEAGPWPCPLTLLEQYFETKGGVDPYQGGFLLHYLDATVYPDIPLTTLVTAAVAICALNLVVYARRFFFAKMAH